MHHTRKRTTSDILVCKLWSRSLKLACYSKCKRRVPTSRPREEHKSVHAILCILVPLVGAVVTAAMGVVEVRMVGDAEVVVKGGVVLVVKVVTVMQKITRCQFL